MERTGRAASDEISFLAALCLVLASVEFAIPKPLPFLRIGLANLPIVISLRKLDSRSVLLLSVLKVLGQALISGTLFSYVFVFSIAGSFSSVAVMLLLTRACGKFVSDFGATVAGSLANNASQIVCARFLLFGKTVRYIAPVMLTGGLASGIVLGAFVLMFENRSAWYASFGSRAVRFLPPESPEPGKSPRSDALWCTASILLLVPFLFVKHVALLWALTALFFVLACVRRRRMVRVLPSVLMTVSVVILSLLVPQGKVLLYVGSWRITEGALVEALRRSGRLSGMVFLSQCAVGGHLALPGAAGRTVSKVLAFFDRMRETRPTFKKGVPVFSVLDGWLMSTCALRGNPGEEN